MKEPEPFAEKHDEGRSQGDKKASDQSDQSRQRGERGPLPGDSVEKMVEPPSRTRRHHGQKKRHQEGTGHEVEETEKEEKEEREGNALEEGGGTSVFHRGPRFSVILSESAPGDKKKSGAASFAAPPMD